jgi:5-methyltetrahydropteroyltriglutamate--homocysteine methyltransferase
MIETTVVGSYPSSLDEDSLIKAYQNKEDVFLELINKSVKDMLSAGIDIVSTGQVRTDMISEFARKFAGIVEKRDKHYIHAKVKFVSSVTLNDIRFARNLIPPSKKIKAPITGAFTLAKSSTIVEHSKYNGIEQLAFDFAEALNHEAREIEPYADIIQIDEPFFSQEFPEYAQDLISIVRRGIKKPVGLHVCGDVSKIFEKLSEFDVDILDHEFSTNPSLLDIVSGINPKQKIGYGCINSSSTEIESVDEIAKNIERAISLLGEEKIMLDPDCGMRHLPREIAYAKLSNMVDARNKVLGLETIAKREILSKKDWDSKGYFYIFLNKERGEIRAEHYSYSHILDRVINGKNAESILHAILKSNLISDTSNGMRHFGYLGTELQKAEIALENNLEYIQDRKII